MKFILALALVFNINSSIFANDFSCEVTPNKVISYIVDNTNFPSQQVREKLLIDYSRFHECVQSHDFWDAYDEFGFGQYGTANGIYQKCVQQTGLPKSCIEDDYFLLILNADDLVCISKLSHLHDNGFGSDSKDYLYVGNEIGTANMLGHGKLYYLSEKVDCRSNHFDNCRVSPSISGNCISHYLN